MTLGEIVKHYRNKNGLSMEAFSNKTKLSKGYISMLEKNKNPKNGKPITPSLDTIKAVANAIDIEINELLSLLDDNQEFLVNGTDPFQYDNIMPISKQKIPLIGEIACGEPITANEELESYVVSGTNINADYCLRCKGDSMINARIFDGDIVFIKQQPTVDNGEIAAVIIDCEATLKRVYFYPDEQTLILQPENPNYKPLIFAGTDLEQVKILGKAVAFQSDVR